MLNKLLNKKLFYISVWLLSTHVHANLEISGITSEGDYAISATCGQLMELQNKIDELRIPIIQKKHSPKKLNRKSILLNPDAPLISSFPQSTSKEIVRSPQRINGLDFTAATLADTNAFPPDSMGAVGPQQFVVAVNGRIRSFSKKTGHADGILNISPDVFFSSVINGSSTSDPRIRYDRFTKRWFIIIITVSTPNRVLIAVSNQRVLTSSTVWSFYYFDEGVGLSTPDNALLDYPTLGIDKNALYIGGNLFDSSGNFLNTAAYVVKKSSLINGGPIIVTSFHDLLDSNSSGPYTPQGVDNFDINATNGYFIGVDANSFGTLVLRIVNNPGGTPTLSSNIFITVPATDQPLLVPHLGNNAGTNGNLDGIDDRLFGAHIRNNQLYTVHNIGVNNTGVASSPSRNGCRWYQLNLQNSSSPVLVQSGTLFQSSSSNDTSQRNYWIPSIMTSGQGHLALGCSVAGAQEYINAATVGRLASDPLGTLESPILYTKSSTAYNPAGDTGGSGGRRWGDFSYTSLDPSDDMTMWTIQEWCNATDSYGVQAVRLLAPPPATPIQASPSTISKGSSNVAVTITGQSVNGSGFFDPGSGFDSRLYAKVTGGVVVTSAQYINPTTVNVTLDATNASLGLQTVTIINADSQHASGAIVTIA